MATINLSSPHPKSLTLWVGLFCALLLSACQTERSPEEVTRLYWQHLATGRINEAKALATKDSAHLINLEDIEKNSTVTVGEAVIEDSDATVQTTVTRHKKTVTFDTVLWLESDDWKVDALKTEMNISMLPLSDVINSLQNLGGVFAKQLEKQIPMIQKEMESLGEELKNQIDELGRSLEKPQGPPAKPTSPGSI